mmetsp:Transcript_26750/g.67080  ORF Transcript_26750/g.67080 Transcript_26750/m.67080 type:complete len:111 (-) Transcript_26750:1763-2095(-)
MAETLGDSAKARKPRKYAEYIREFGEAFGRFLDAADPDYEPFVPLRPPASPVARSPHVSDTSSTEAAGTPATFDDVEDPVERAESLARDEIRRRENQLTANGRRFAFDAT